MRVCFRCLELDPSGYRVPNPVCPLYFCPCLRDRKEMLSPAQVDWPWLLSKSILKESKQARLGFLSLMVLPEGSTGLTPHHHHPTHPVDVAGFVFAEGHFKTSAL